MSVTPLATGESSRGGYLVVFQDLTEIRRLEQEVRTKEKLAAVGEMAAQLAHEIRNPLGSIRGSAQVLMGEPALGRSRGACSTSSRASRSGSSETLNRFLYEARPSSRPRARWTCGRCVEETVTLLRNGAELRPGHEVRFQADAGPHVCLADADQIKQVLWNLPRNALEAMPDGGRLEVHLRRESADVVLTRAGPGPWHGARRAGPHVRALPAPPARWAPAWASRSCSASCGTTAGTSRCAAPPAGHARSTSGSPRRGRPAGMSERGAPKGGLGIAPARPRRGGRGTFAGALLGPGVFFQRDILSYWYPGMAAFRRAVAEGAWPLWNPHAGFGAPLLADASFQIAYPPTWLALAAASRRALRALRRSGTACGRRRAPASLARRLGVGAWGPRAAGGAYALSGPFLSAASLFHHYAGACVDALGARGARVALLPRPGAPRCGWALARRAASCSPAPGTCAWRRPARRRPRRLARGARAPVRRTDARRLGSRLLLAVSLAARARRGAVAAHGGAGLAGSRPGQGAAARVLVAAPPVARRPRWCRGSSPARPSPPSRGRSSSRGGRRCSTACTSAPWPSRSAGSRWRPAALGARRAPPARSSSSSPRWGATPRSTRRSRAARLRAHAVPAEAPRCPLALCSALAAGLGASLWAGAVGRRQRRRRGRVTAWVAMGLGCGAGAGSCLAVGRARRARRARRGAGRCEAPALAASLRVARTALFLGAFGLLLALRADRERARALTTLGVVALGAWTSWRSAGRSTRSAPAELVSHRPAVVDVLVRHAEAARVQSLTMPGCGAGDGGAGGMGAVLERGARVRRCAAAALRACAGGSSARFDGEFTGLEPRAAPPFLPAAVRLSGTPTASGCCRSPTSATW